MTSLTEGLLLGMGNPLLDISVCVDKDLLDKYQLKPDDAIMAEDRHKPLYGELMDSHGVEYIAGGSVQNSVRVAQWLLGQHNVCTYFGCVGKDKYAEILKERASSDGVNVQYQITDKEPTGTCAVLITGTHRSLCANLAAAMCFTPDHLETKENQELIRKAKFFYTSGFFLASSAESIMRIAEHAHQGGHMMVMNISAPFVSQFYREPLLEVLPYVDIFFGNETEMLTFSQEMKFGTQCLKEIALKTSQYPKKNQSRPRVVVITQGRDPVLLVHQGVVTEIPVVPLAQEKIVDTNGAGDAFTGGFLSQLVLGKPYEMCVKCGIWAASQIIQRSGCTFQGEPGFLTSEYC